MKTHPAKDHRIMFGLVTLLFIVSFANMGATLKIFNELRADGTAQVIQASKTSLLPGSAKDLPSCLEVSPKANIIEAAPVTYPLQLSRNHQMLFNVKNNCSYNVYVVNPRSIVGQLTNPVNPIVSAMEGLTIPSYDPVVINPLSNIQGVYILDERMSCVNCSISPSLYVSPVGSFPDGFGTLSIETFQIPPSATKIIMLGVTLDMEWSVNKAVRIVPKAIKWIKESAVTDGTVVANEIKTHHFGAIYENLWASDYSRIY